MTGDEEIGQLFSRTYGIDKKGEPYGHAKSILSKYLYFLSSFNFPIHDTILINKVDVINSHFHICTYNDRISLFDKLKKIKNVSGYSYDDIDNAIWLYGKLTQGSLSLLMNKSNYLRIISDSNINIDGKNSVNKLLKNWLFDNENDEALKSILGTSFLEFLQETRIVGD
jgi:hypothetical protein